MRGDPAMTFQEIADALGMKRCEVLADYTKAVNKLKRSPALKQLVVVGEVREQMAERRQMIEVKW